jgi:protein-disulfide isomerase
MSPIPVNRTAPLGRAARAAFVAAVCLACTPASSSTRGAESTASVSASRASTTSASTSPATQPAAAKDPDVTRADLARIAGNPAAKTWVIIVSDFQCPYCKQWHDETYPVFVNEYVKTGKVRFAYINYPLSSHMNAWPAAQSAMCAAAQDKFWPMHDAIFATQAAWEVKPAPMPVFDSLARSLKLDVKRWSDCVASGKMRSLIQADHDRALAAGVDRTPSFLIGGSLAIGAIPIEDMRKAVDSAIAKAGQSPP